MPQVKGPKLARFAAGPFHNVWLNKDGLEVYVRNTLRVIPTVGQVKSLDIANVINRKKGTGMFSKWLEYAERIAQATGYEIVYVENLLNERLAEFLVRMGYELHPGWCGGPDSYYKVLPKPVEEWSEP